MAKQLNIDLSFNADTSKAKAQIADLQKSLDQLISSTIKNNNQLGIDKEIKQAIDDATKLKVALQAATDADTGKLNLAKFSESLKNSQMSLQAYAQHLKALGPEGEQSFLKLSKAIVSAETPMRQTNTLLNNMFVTLKNTAKWQISSSILHGLQAGLSGAFSYAKELDTSLNNIRIVTGYGVDEMARFAEQANKAAQALSTTTTSYTDAALIYYQQGLSDEEVLGRTETTIKLANVSRQSAEEVSDQLTSIWNNFYDGSKSLEYYADVITALGAATASSSEEISTGLEKFAAVSKTVGLSYEYATAALATITATTRQSADTVGTGLRTLFTRLEGLKLGETLEDGVDLNKYSAALSAVGVQILDTSGELRNMDDILEDLGEKWQQLGRDQKMALAQTVGGVRQYTNLIALMDNWDFMQENLITARGSEGTLQQQADIYAQSWEAAQKRVRAAAQQVYKDLIDEKFFIRLSDFLTGAINGVDNFINAIGGIPGAIAGVGVVLTTVFGKQLSESVNSAMYEFSRFTGKAEDVANKTRLQAMDAVNSYYDTTGASGGTNDSVASALLRQEINDNYELQKITSQLTEEQRAFAQAILDSAEAYDKLAIEAEKTQKEASNDLGVARGQLRGSLGASVSVSGESAAQISKNGQVMLTDLEETLADQFNEMTNGAYKFYTSSLKEADDAAKELVVAKNELINITNKENVSEEEIKQKREEVAQKTQILTDKTKVLQQAKDGLKESELTLSGSSQELIAYLKDQGLMTDENKDKVLAFIKALEGSESSTEEFIRKTKVAFENQNSIPDELEKIRTGFQNIGTGAVGSLKSISQLAMGFTSLKGAMDALNNTDLTFFEKFSRVSMGLSIGISQLAAGFPTLVKGLTGIGIGIMKLIPAANGAGAALSAAFGTAVGPIAIAAEAIIAVGLAIWGLKAAWENFTPEGKLAVAEKEAKNAKDAYDKAKAALDSFKSGYDNWSSLYEKTQKLKKGTDEYTNSILEANKAAQDLIDKYDLIAGTDYELDENGVIRFKSSAENKQRKETNETFIEKANKDINERNEKIHFRSGEIAQNYATRTDYAIYNGNDIENFARQLSSGSLTERDILSQIATYGLDRESSNNLISSIRDLAIEISNTEKANKIDFQQARIADARISLGENYSAGMEPLLNKFLKDSPRGGRGGSIDGEEIYGDAHHIAKIYNDTLNSINSNDIDDSTKKQLAYALAEAQLSGSERVDLSGIDTSNWTETFIKKTFGENAEKIQAAVDRKAKEIDTSVFENKIADVHKILNKLKDDAVLEPKDFEALNQASDLTSDYFIEMADGTHKLIGDAKEFYNLVHGEQVDNIKKEISRLSEESKEIKDRRNLLVDEETGETRYLGSEKGENLLFSNAWGSANAYSLETYNPTVLEDQLNLLKSFDDFDQSKITEWEKDGLYNRDEMQAVADALSQYREQIVSSNEKTKEIDQSIEKLSNTALFESKTFNELDNNLADLAQRTSGNIELTKGYQVAFDNIIKTELSSIGVSEDVFDQHVKTIKRNADAIKDDENAVKRLALANLRVQQGIKSLGQNINTYTENLVDSKKDTLEYAESMNGVKDTMSQILGISKEDISNDFILKNLEDIKLAAEDDEEALERLREKANREVVAKIKIEDEDLKSQLDLILNDLEAEDLRDIELGMSINENEVLTNYVNLLNRMSEEAAGAGEDISSALQDAMDSINFDPEIDYDTISVGDEDLTESATDGYVEIPSIHTSADGTIESTTTRIPLSTYQQAQANGLTEIRVPRINGKKTVSKGGVNSNASTSNKSGKGGGGGGSAPKPAKKQKTTDPNTGIKDIDRYIKINQQLDEKEHENTMADARLKATSGRSAIKIMEEQLGILKQQKVLYDELAKEAKQYREDDLKKLQSDFADLNFEIDPNQEGMLLNYEALLKAETEAYNKVQEEWNKKIIEAEKAYNDEFVRLGTAATEEALKPWKDALDKVKEESEEPLEEAAQRYELFKKDTDKYNDSVEQERKANEEAIQKANEKYSKELEIIAKGVELKIKVDDADLQYLEFLLEQIGEGADRALDRMSNFSWQLEDNMNKIDKYQEGLDKVLEHAGLDYQDLLNGDIDGIGTFNEEDLSKVEEYRDGLIACGEQLLELRKTILEEVSAAFDEFNSDLDRAIDRVDHLRRFTETYKNILDIVGKDVVDPTGRTTNMLARTAFTQAQANANALQTQLDMQLSAIDDYNRTIANLQSDNRYGEHDDTIKEFKNQLKEAEDAYAATQEEWLGAWEETVQAAADIYEATMLQIIEDFGKSISGLAGSLEELDTRFNRAKSLADTYVDDYEKIYQLSKLNRDINNSIDDTDNIRSKQRLRDLQEQINDLQASDNQMSEYEIENLRRRYELELAYLQLEEARDAKSQVRMVRDNEGNWGYIYTADETAVEEAEQNYEDKLYAMQKANTEYIESLESEILQLEQEWSDALAGIRVQDYASYEEYQEAIDRTNDYYTQKLDQTYEQMGIAIDNNKVLYDEDWAAYSAATGYKISEDERFIDDFKETTLSLTTGYQTIEDAQNAFRDATLNVTNDMVQAFQDWERDTNTALELGGTDIQNYAEDVNEAINGDGGIVDQTEDAVEAAETMSDEYQDAFTEIIDYAGTFCSDFDDIIQRVIDDCNEAVDAIRRLVEEMDRENERNNNNNEDTYANWEAQLDEAGNLSGWKAKDRNGNYITGSGKKLYWGGNEQISGYTTTYDFDANGNLIIDGKNAVGSGFAGSTLSEEEKRKLLKKAAHADTGMYTGNWGSPEGRLAVLHEKELVLNKDDTSNFLSAIGMIRDISSMIDLNSVTSSNLMASMFGIKGVSTGTDTLEQEVTIHAEFPNVQNHSEIEEAFDNLINKASQYANRKI